MPAITRAILTSAALCLALPNAAVAQARVPAWTYTLNFTTDSGGTNRSSMAMRHQVSDRVLRQEFIQVSGTQMTEQIEGMYTLLNDADSTMTMVMPAQHTAMVMPMGQMLSSTLASMKMSVHSEPPTIVDLGDGGRMLGHPTRHYRVTTVGSIDLTMGDRTCHQSMTGESETWVAADIGLSAAMLAEAQHYLRYMGASSMPDVTSTTKAFPQGMPLKTVSRSTRGGQTVTTTMQVVELSHSDVDASTFTVPADYQTMNMGNMLKAVPPQTMDSIMAAQQEKRSADCP